jgi:hypothetical protein
MKPGISDHTNSRFTDLFYPASPLAIQNLNLLAIGIANARGYNAYARIPRHLILTATSVCSRRSNMDNS